ncbi:uncharacterized protein LOC126850654 [Cataglyphis hispanica]|uniref:uncharacterized protein LOC126850654 n=1 Tax=Cataglyphis hispanica TaxID=1086592 RepID=UPI0021808154|nr:uncharacterized protein LOC126850654 [Cataglyphis hispanica]
MFGGSGNLWKCGKPIKKWAKLLSLEVFIRDVELIPLAFLTVWSSATICFWTYHRLFISTIDVQMTQYARYEIPSVPKFFDLRNPRSLKILTFTHYKPAIHLDNRYRLMRHEPMLDADYKETDQIGEDNIEEYD